MKNNLWLNKNHAGTKIIISHKNEVDLRTKYIASIDCKTITGQEQWVPKTSNICVWVVDSAKDNRASWLELESIVWFDNPALDTLYGKHEYLRK